MKTLTNYINEGLIADIILKLVDASLSWIGGASKFIGDNLVNATGELWKSGKGMTKEFWDDFRERSHFRGDGMPRNEKELSKYLAEMYKYNSLDEVREFLEKYKDTLPSDFTVNFLVGKAKETLLNDKSSKEEKTEALKILEEAKKKYPKLKDNIDEILNEYKKKNKGKK
jgi:hypothetical protein